MEVDRTLLREMLALTPRERINTMLGFGRDVETALRTLQQHGVRFIVIGEIAARLHGAPTMMAVVQICYDNEPENCRALLRVLETLDARARIDAPAFERTLSPNEPLQLATSAGFLDCVGTGFASLVETATEFEFAERLRVLVAAPAA
jgi:hypothetical protein